MPANTIRASYPERVNERTPALDNWINGVGAVLFLLLAAALASRVAPRRSRIRHFSIREAVLALCGITAVSAILTIACTYGLFRLLDHWTHRRWVAQIAPCAPPRHQTRPPAT